MSGKLLHLKQKIKSTKKTKKITKAMELVAASKMKKYQTLSGGAKQFSLRLYSILNSDLFEQEQINNPLVTSKKGKNLVVLYSSDKGLCGGMNNKIFKKVLSSNEINVKQDLFIVIGKKGKNFAQKNNLNVERFFNDLPESINYFEIIQIVDEVISTYLNKSISQVIIVAPNLKSTTIFNPVLKKVLPLNKANIKSLISINNADISEVKQPVYVEPSIEEFIKNLVEDILISVFFSTFLELKAVEYSSRMMAMQAATKNANELIDNLTLQFNTSRQAKITQEIVEIINGV